MPSLRAGAVFLWLFFWSEFVRKQPPIVLQISHLHQWWSKNGRAYFKNCLEWSISSTVCGCLVSIFMDHRYENARKNIVLIFWYHLKVPIFSQHPLKIGCLPKYWKHTFQKDNFQHYHIIGSFEICRKLLKWTEILTSPQYSRKKSKTSVSPISVATQRCFKKFDDDLAQ